MFKSEKNYNSSMSKWITKDKVSLALVVILVMQQFIDLDYLLHPFFKSFHSIQPSTIIRFILMPLLVVLSFVVFEKQKKKVFLLGSAYVFTLILYFIFHSITVQEFLTRVYFTDNFVYKWFKEFSYALTLVLPVGFIYSFYHMSLKKINLAIVCMSYSISIPCIFSNIFLFSNSSYYGKTVAPFWSWFYTKYDAFAYNPRFYSSVFYFPEANTLGILLVTMLPILIYILEKDRKILNWLVVILHVFCMQLLGTRVASYGSILIPILMFAGYLVLSLFKKQTLKKPFLGQLLLAILLVIVLFPFNPATSASKIDQSNNSYVVGNDKILSQRKEDLAIGSQHLRENTIEFRDYYIHYFEDNLFLIGYLPVGYYLYNYHYRNDPKFWVDFIFEYRLEERINARQFQEIFMNYKWQETNSKEKLFGMGWTPFMLSSTDLEKDFALHRYSFGYIGFLLLVSYWLFIFVYCTLKVLLQQKRWNYFSFALLLSFAICLLTSYVSGHGIDNFTVNIFLSFVVSLLLRSILKGDVHEI